MTNTETEITTPVGEPFIIIRRFFQASPDLVYRACTEGEYLRRWWGPRRLEVSECEIDLRVGGGWRIVQRAPDGMEFAFHGEFLELDPPRRRVGTFVYEGAPEHEAVETLVLEAVGGGTMLTATTRHSSVEGRDMHVANGMEQGIIESNERLEELLASLQSETGEDGRSVREAG
jgi:uncharacterized protein YndB with AHSA1/START domain